MKNKIGIFGGTFDPIHNGHLMIAQAAYEELSLQKVIFMPAYNPPHKCGTNITNEQHRYNMCRLAVEPVPYFACSDLEIRLKGASYTARTLSMLKEQQPQDTFVFIVGADSYLTLDHWYHPEVIFQTAEIACAYRDGVLRRTLEQKAQDYKKEYQAVSHILHMPDIDVSSTKIRSALRNHEPVKELLPANVYNYMKENNLYVKD